MIQAIQTSYKGYKFRSRLEARWAVFFDAIGNDYEYEKEGFDFDGEWYLPDFWLPFPKEPKYGVPGRGIWIEIKPIQLTCPEKRLLIELAKRSGNRAYALVGNPWPGDHFVDVYFPAEPSYLNGIPLHELYEGKPEDIFRSAFIAARSARFEHGESPF